MILLYLLFHYSNFLILYNNLQGEYFVTRGTVVFIKKESMYYAACPSDGCNKKVVEDGENSYRCEKCSRSYDHVEYRYIMRNLFVLSENNIIIKLFDHQ